MARVTHTVNVVYGSYSIVNLKIDCDETETILELKERIKAVLDLNFLTNESYSVTVTNTVPKQSEY